MFITLAPERLNSSQDHIRSYLIFTLRTRRTARRSDWTCRHPDRRNDLSTTTFQIFCRGCRTLPRLSTNVRWSGLSPERHAHRTRHPLHCLKSNVHMRNWCGLLLETITYVVIKTKNELILIFEGRIRIWTLWDSNPRQSRYPSALAKNTQSLTFTNTWR